MAETQPHPAAPKPSRVSSKQKKRKYADADFTEDGPKDDEYYCEAAVPHGDNMTAIKLVCERNHQENKKESWVEVESNCLVIEGGRFQHFASTDERLVPFKVTGLEYGTKYRFSTQLKIDGSFREKSDPTGRHTRQKPTSPGADVATIGTNPPQAQQTTAHAPAPAPTAAAPAPAPALDPDRQPGGKFHRPAIALLERDYTTGDACAKLLVEILEHQDLHKQRRGDIGENIFAMLAPAEFEVPFAAVAIVGAHECGGVGDGGKDVIIRDARNSHGFRIHIVDVKAWRTGSVGARQVRSIGGALGVRIPGQTNKCKAKVAIVATNQDFSRPAEKYSNEFNANPDNGANKVLLWNEQKFKEMITGAATSDTEFGWDNNVAQFIKDVLCYLDHKELIYCEAARTNRASLEAKVGCNLNDLFSPIWAR